MTEDLLPAESSANIASRRLELLQGQKANTTLIPYRCERCRLVNVMVRAGDGNAYNVDSSRYRLLDSVDRQGKRTQFLQIEMEGMRPQDFGDYFAIIQNGDGLEERIKVLSVLSPDKDCGNIIKTVRLSASLEVGGHFDRTINYECEGCKLTDILCNGESALTAGRLSLIPVSKMINFNFPRFEDNHACVYIGFFKDDKKVYQKILGVIEKVSIPYLKVVTAPKEGEQFQYEIPFNCENCLVDRVYCDGIQLDAMTSTRRSGMGSMAFYTATATEITIRVTEFSATYEGVYQAVFVVGGDTITKTILEIRDPETHVETDANSDQTTVASEVPTEVATTPAAEASETAADAVSATTAPPK